MMVSPDFLTQFEAERDALRATNRQLAEANATLTAELAALEALGGQADDFFDLVAHLRRQRRFSEKTFGPGARTNGVIQHIRKELVEIENDPTDVEEWVDVVLLALDGAWRAGWTPEGIAKAIEAKQTKNEGRTWPDWRTASPDAAIEHDRTAEPATNDDARAILHAMASESPLEAAVTAHTEHVAVTVERVAGLLRVAANCLDEAILFTTDEAAALVTALLADGAVHNAWLHGRGGR